MAETKEIVKVDKQFTRAKVDASTFDREKRTIEVTFATETPVRTYDWEVGSFKEVLSCDPSHVDLTRMKSGAPVLDNHNRWGKTKESVVGVVEDAWIADNECRARIRFSSSEDDSELMEKVAEGIVTGVSAGYDVYAYELTRATVEGELPVYKAVNWMPSEISFVPVQADINSRVRSQGNEQHEATVNDVSPAAPTTEENPNPENSNNNNSNEMTEEEKPTPQPAPEGLDQARSAGAAEERERISVIRSVTRSLKLPDSFADTLINDPKVTAGVARERAIAEWEKGNPINPNPQPDPTKADKTRAAMANALTLRVYPAITKEMGEDNVRAASEYRGMSLLRMAEAALEEVGVNTRGMNPKTIAQLALGEKVRGLHHTTDFPLLLGDTVHRTLLAQYALQERTFMAWARRASISDFRPITRARLSTILGNLEEVKEGQEYKYGSLTESGETYQLAKYGKIIGITWESIVNDDLDAFSRLPQGFAALAAIKQTELVYNTILSGGFALMGDGKALFHADHKNFTGTAGNQTTGGTALSETSLDVAYQLFMAQTNEAGQFINVKPKFLIVGPKNAAVAMKLTSANYTPNTQMNQPLAQSLGLQVIVDANITGFTWFLTADPNVLDTVEYAFLDGEEELFIDQREGFNIDGIEIKARMVFAAKAIDWRGLYRNNGAAQA